MSKGKNLGFSYVNEKEKRVTGAAAFMHLVYTVMGGEMNYNDMVGGKYVERFINSISEAANEDVAQTAKKKLFKRVV